MNLLKRQGFYNSITLYLGTALGFFNLIIIFQRVLSLEEIGFFNIMIAVSLLYIQIATLGFTSVITRYLPFFRTEDKKHGGFPLFVFAVCIVAFLILTAVFLLFRESVLEMYLDKDGSSLLGQYYLYIIPVSFCLMLFTLQEIFSRTVFKTILPAFLREVILRVFTSVGILLVLIKMLDYEGFIAFYLLANLVVVLIISFYNYKIKAYRFSAISEKVRSEAGTMMKYGMFSMLGGSSFALVQNLDVIILRILTDEATVGIYSTFFLIAVVITLPSKALNTTSYQIIADALKEEDIPKIGRIYHKTSVVQFLIGCLLLIGLIVNKKSLLFLLHKEEYINHFNIFIIVGLGFLADITGGLNSAIISFSKHYKMVMGGLMGAAVICGILNFTLVPLIGMTGAALSYLLTMLALNFIYWLYIKLKFGLQPFNAKHIYILGVASVGLITGLLVPQISNFYLDVLVRSTIVTFVYTALAYWLKISPDINEVIEKVLKDARLLTSRK